MPGSATFDPYELPLSRDSAVISVYHLTLDDGRIDTPAHNVVCEQIQYRSGQPGSARFRYITDDNAKGEGYPTRFDKIFPFDAAGGNLFKQDYRIGVFRELGDNKREILFDGFTQVPQVDLDSESQPVTFTALATPIRCFDDKIRGAFYRDADDPATGEIWETKLPTRFNPDGKPNATPTDYDEDESGDQPYPVFLPAGFVRSPLDATYWTLGRAIRYILANFNGEEFVRNDDFGVIDEHLKAIVPKGGEEINLDDDTTYELKEIVIRDFDATGLTWPEAVNRLIGQHGFRMDFILDSAYEDTTDGSGSVVESAKAKWMIEFHREDGYLEPDAKTLKMQNPGEILDPGKTNLSNLKLARDTAEVANAIVVDTAPTRYEVSVILAPGFTPDSADALNRDAFRRSKMSDANRDKYRLYIFDECGDGHWDVRNSTTSSVPGDFGDKLSGDNEWVKRYRPALNKLLTRDSRGRLQSAKLWVSTDYPGPACNVWNKLGTWQQVSSGWRVLDDRLGIYFDVEDTEEIHTGSPGSQTRGGMIRGITQSATPDNTIYKKFYLRLDCVIEGDDDCNGIAIRRPSSSTQYTTTRIIDARDHFRKEMIHESSPNYSGSNANNQVVRDDTEKAKDYARAIQRATELAKFAGTATIPRFTTAYAIGDRISKIDGRNMSLRSSAGTKNENPRYPSVIGLDWTFGTSQSTTLHLSDRRAEPLRL